MRAVNSGLLLVVVFIAAVWAFAPGLTGGFLFDDLVNLPALGEYGGVHSLQSFGLYLTSGSGDPLGRPLSLLSFLIDARTWPADPRPFLRTNLAIHLLNGLLLTAVLSQLGRSSGMSDNARRIAAVAAAGCWILHPLQLSTTFYIVQREAMLAATFTLLAFLAWLQGRRLFHSAATRKSGLAWLTAGAWIFSLLGALCKANGLLIPLLLLAAECTVLKTPPVLKESSFPRVRRVLIAIPSGLLVAALFAGLPRFLQITHEVRPWTISQRLLTEPRVLMDYAQLLIFPRPLSRGVFHDEFVASSGLFAPASTMIALAALIGTVAFAWRYRRSWPSASFAILFFLAGHLLESTFIPLELYFEHRNYLPSLMLFWPLSRCLTSPADLLRPLRSTAMCLVLIIFALETHLGAQIWGNPERLALAWGDRNVESPRAQAYAAQFEISDGHIEMARRRLTAALRDHPDEPQLVFNLINAECATGAVLPETSLLAERAVRANAGAAALDLAWITDNIAKARDRTCAGLDTNALERILAAARANANFANAPGRIQDFDHLQGMIALSLGDADRAFASFEAAIQALPELPVAIEQAAMLGETNQADLGLRHLNGYLLKHPLEHPVFGMSAPSLHAWLLDKSGFWQNEIDRVRSLLENASMSDHTNSP